MYTASNPLHCPRAAKPLPRPALLQPLRSTRHQHAAPPNLMRARPSTAPTLTHSLRACSPSGRTTSTQRISNVQYAQTHARAEPAYTLAGSPPNPHMHSCWLAGLAPSQCILSAGGHSPCASRGPSRLFLLLPSVYSHCASSCLRRPADDTALADMIQSALMLKYKISAVCRVSVFDVGVLVRIRPVTVSNIIE